jgi:hypothetical protein
MHPDGQDIPARPDSRHHRRDRVLAWAPGLADPRPTEEPSSDTQPLRRPDTLGELDLAIVPVSVTPPRTWRRAAWFAVGASCGVLTMLVFAAVRLAGPDRIDAFPGLPTGSLLTAQPLGPSVHPETPEETRADRSGSSGGSGQPDTTADGAPGEGGPTGTSGSDGRWNSTRTWTVAPTGDGPHGESVTEPTIIMLPATGRPPVSAEELVEGTKRFYGLLPHNIEAAWAMVGPRVKAQGYENFRKQWADATVVRLRQVTVDADDSAVLATVHMITTDGAEHVQRFRMTFRKGHSLVIDEIVPLADDGRPPAG